MKISKIRNTIAIVLISSSLTGCYVYREQEKALVPGINIDETLKVADAELNQNKFSTVLTIWAIRDQELSPAQAKRISDLYFGHIDRIDSEAQKAHGFSVWHLTWAISDMYRLGNDGVKLALKAAYDDAAKRVKKLDSSVADRFFYDKKMSMGDIHFGGRSYAKSHLVVPGNDKYLQSFEEYERDQAND